MIHQKESAVHSDRVGGNQYLDDRAGSSEATVTVADAAEDCSDGRKKQGAAPMGNYKPSPEADLANRVLVVSIAINSVTKAWAPVLVDPLFDHEPEIRSRLFTLLVCGLFDACEEYQSRLNGLRISARKLNTLASAHYLDLSSRFLALTLDLIKMFSPSEMVVIAELRNQWLHGHWDEIHKSTRLRRYVKDGKVMREKIDSADYNKILEDALKAGTDHALEPLRDRLCNYRTFFWAVERGFAIPELQQRMQYDLMLGSAFQKPSAAMNFPDPSFRPTTENPDYATLFELYAKIADPRRRKDPVVAH